MDNKQAITSNLMSLWFLMGNRHAQGARQRGDSYDASRGRGRIIALLQLKDGISTKEISQILDIRVSSTNEVLSKMEDAGLIERRPSETDRRVMLVYLTDKGRKVEFDEPEEFDPYAGFDECELENLKDYTDRMLKNTEAGFDPAFIKRMKERRARSAEFYRHHGPNGSHPDMHGFGDTNAWMGPHPGPGGRPHDRRDGHGHGEGHRGHDNRGHGFDGRPRGFDGMDPRFFDDRFFNPRF